MTTVTTLAAAELAGFLQRSRKSDPLDPFEQTLTDQLRSILERLENIVPSAGGAVLLDDPRMKRASKALPASESVARLTIIAGFGPADSFAVGTRLDAAQGVAGNVYTSGATCIASDIIGAPIIIGQSTCGVVMLKREPTAPAFSDGDVTLLRLFGEIVAANLQNALDALQARELLRRDSLTGLFNDRFLYRRIEEELIRTERDGTSLSLLFLDLDDFKQINDRFGHLAGSRTLREMGPVLTGSIPPGAIAVRYGGDEFVVLLVGADSRAARAVGEQIRHAVESAQFSFLPPTSTSRALTPTIAVTCSVGVCSYQEHVSPLGTLERRQNALLHLADAAMYAAKAAGKNQVRIAHPEV